MKSRVERTSAFRRHGSSEMGRNGLHLEQSREHKLRPKTLAGELDRMRGIRTELFRLFFVVYGPAVGPIAVSLVMSNMVDRYSRCS